MMHQLLPSPGKRYPAAGCISVFYLLLALSLPRTWAMSPLMLADDSKSYNVQCGECDESRCPVLSYCEGRAIKDSCNCCTVCSSPKYQPHVSVVGGELGLAAPLPATGDTPKHECGKVECPKFQVCVANMQGLPLCKCPSEFLCHSNRKRAICGTDGITYESKCHMRIASCKQGMMVRKKHRGVCTADDKRDGETFKRKMRRRMRRRRRRQKLEEATAVTEGTGADTAREDEIGEGEEKKDEGALTSFLGGSDVFGNEDRRGRLEQRSDQVGSPGGKRDKRKDKKAKLKRRRRRKKNRKQRKQRKGGKRGKNERRRRRRKRQHGKPRSRSKRHRHTKNFDNAEVRARLFEEEFGQSTWFA